MNNNEYIEEDEEKEKSSVDVNDVRKKVEDFKKHIDSKNEGLNRNTINKTSEGIKRPGGMSHTPNMNPGFDKAASAAKTGATTTSGGVAGGGATVGGGVPVATSGAAAGGGAAAATSGAVAGGGAAAATSGAVVGGGAAAATGGAASSAAASTATAAAANPIGLIIIAVVIVILLIITIVLVQSSIFALSSSSGVSEDEIVSNPDYLYEKTEDGKLRLKTLDELNESLGNFAKNCEGDWLENFFKGLDAEISSLCEAVTYINKKMEETEKEYSTILSRGLLISTLYHLYDNQLQYDEEGKKIESVDMSSALNVFEDIFLKNTGLISKDDIDKLINSMVFKYDYVSYNWESTSEKKEIDGKEYIYHYWSCNKNEEIKEGYFDYKKYFLYLRYGEEISEGYESEQNLYFGYSITPTWCKDESDTPERPTDTDSEKHFLADDYRKEPLEYFKSKIISSEDNLSKFSQVSNVYDYSKQDNFNPVYISGVKKDLNYKNGFIYQKFLDLKTQLGTDEIKIPKRIEKVIEDINQHEDLMNSILGYDQFSSMGGFINGNQSVDTTWPYFPAGVKYRATKSTMLTCRCKKGGVPDFHAAVDIHLPAGTIVTCPLNGTVIKSHFAKCGHGMVDVKTTIPGTTIEVVIQYTHLMENTLLPKNSQVIANSTVIGKISTGKGDVCSGGTHLDLKIYNYANKHYYNPSVFTYGIINGLTDIPVSSYINGYRGMSGASGYDSSCQYKC